MMDETVATNGAAVVQRLLKCIEHESGMCRPACSPADDPPGKGIDHKGDVDEAGPAGDISEVGDPWPKAPDFRTMKPGEKYYDETPAVFFVRGALAKQATP